MSKEQKKKGGFKPSLLLVVGGVALLLLFSIPIDSQKDQVSLKQLAQDINNEEVEKITALNDELSITYNNGTEKISRKDKESSVVESLKSFGAKDLGKVDIVFKNSDGVWSSLGSIAISLIPSLIIVFIFWKLLSSARNNATKAFDFTKAKAQLFGAGGKKEKDETDFDDVGGLAQAKQELKEVVDFLKNPEKYFDIGAQIPRGVLLVGPPGTGKTLLARAVANEAGVPFFSISGSEFIELFVGVGASRVRNLFEQAKKAGKAIIFIDELDSIGKSRGQGISGGGLEEREQTLNQILTEMDGFDRGDEVIVMGATNKPKALDSALLRPGRFDRRIVLEVPDIKDREEILKIHASNKKLENDVNLREVAERTPGFSGADLESLLNEAAIASAQDEKKKIPQEEILKSIEKVLLGPEKQSHLLNKEEKKIAAFHEAGHAIVSASTAAKTVRKVSIVARGLAAGYTLKIPNEERKLRNREYFINEIAILFGGYVSEDMTFGEISTGAKGDLAQATKIAKSLVKQYGMSDLGPISYSDENFNSVFEKRMLESRQYSEQTANIIDKEIREILREGKKKAEKIIRNNKESLERLANVLIEKETVEKEEFEKIINQS